MQTFQEWTSPPLEEMPKEVLGKIKELGLEFSAKRLEDSWVKFLDQRYATFYWPMGYFESWSHEHTRPTRSRYERVNAWC